MQDIVKIVIPIVVIHGLILAGIILVIRRLLVSDTMRAVERINQVEADVRKKEESLRKEIEEREKELARRKAEAEEELQRHQEDMAREMAALKDKMTADARKESDRIVDQARRNEEKLRQQLNLQAEQRAVEYGLQVAGLVFSEKLLNALDRHFVDELVDALEGMDTAGISVDASRAEITSCHPLLPEQKDRLTSILSSKFGAAVTVEEKTDPELQAGLILKLGSLEIDGSLRNRFREATDEIKKAAHV